MKSLPKHFDDLELYIDSFDFRFSIIGVTETWLDEYKYEMYNMCNYDSVHRYRNGKKGGGVSVYIHDKIPFIIREDLEYFDSEMEAVFIEIEKNIFNTKSNILVGVIYRMPNTSISIFNDRISGVLNIVHRERKVCYFLWDLSIDFLKHSEHSLTSECLDILYSHSVFPMITKPTRITENSATLIDHILTDNINIDSDHIQGILCYSISDHYGIFHVTGASCVNAAEENPIMKRDMSSKNTQIFISEISRIDWSCVTEIDDTQLAFSEFHEIINKKYNCCFPFKKQKKVYFNCKPWLTAALKQSIKTRNKLFITRYKGRNVAENCAHYKLFRNRLDNILRSAERQYYYDRLCEYKSNLRNSWQVIKFIINKRKSRPANNSFVCIGNTIEDGEEISEPASGKDPVDYMTKHVGDTFKMSPVTENEVAKIIENFKDSAAGWDDLRPNVMKSIKYCIKIPLTHISNLSFVNGIFGKKSKCCSFI